MKWFEILLLVLVVGFALTVFAIRIKKLIKKEPLDCDCASSGKSNLVKWYHKTYKCNCSKNK